MQPPDVEDVPSRRALLAYVRAHPGAHLRELERGTGLALGVLRHHIDALLDAGLVREEPDGRFRRFFPVELDEATRRVLRGLRPRSHRAIVLYLLNHPGSTHSELAAALHLPPSTVSHYLRALVTSGIVVRDKDRTLRLAEPEATLHALLAYRQGFADRLVDAALELWFDGPGR